MSKAKGEGERQNNQNLLPKYSKIAQKKKKNAMWIGKCGKVMCGNDSSEKNKKKKQKERLKDEYCLSYAYVFKKKKRRENWDGVWPSTM